METIFAFDVGIGSLGVAVRRDLEIVHAESLLWSKDAGDLSVLRGIRRQFRTRLAHKAREEWLNKKCIEVGIPVLQGRIPGNSPKGIASAKGDPRLEREFPEHGDHTVYTSALLRMMLLRGERLEGWQVYKALRSAIQRRGFDPGIPWKEQSEDSKKEDSDTAEKANAYHRELEQITGGRAEWMYPCYFDAFKMGLWNPSDDIIRTRIDQHAGRARKYTPSRALVESELLELLRRAAVFYPKLQGREKELVHGVAQKPYASHYPELREQFGLKEGAATDWDALLGQKIPRFNNRLPGQCALLPRFNVCSASDTAVMEATFLLKLKNLRYFDTERRELALDARQIATLLAEARAKRDKDTATPEKIAKAYGMTKTVWRKWLKENALGTPLPGHEDVEAPNIGGRSRFSRPAARIMRDLVLSGLSPWRFHDEKSAELCARYKIAPDELGFLKTMPDDWNNIYVPAIPLAGMWNKRNELADADRLVAQLIGKQRGEKIKLLLNIFDRTMVRLIAEHGRPDHVVIEFVREDFLGKDAKLRLAENQRKNREARDAARKDADGRGIRGGANLAKIRLLKEQADQCPYTGENLSPLSLDELEIDHAVPRHGGFDGSDSYFNRVVTRRTTNAEKGDRTPYQFLMAKNTWDAFCNRVESMSELPLKKKKLLTSQNPEELDEKWGSLAVTAWVARLSRDLVCLRCGWQPGAADEERHVSAINGTITAAVRRKYDINSLLAKDETDPDMIDKKNRDDNRHHALDAMVLAYIPEWTRNLELRKYFKLPPDIHRDYFCDQIAKVVPRNVMLTAPALEQTFYAARNSETGKVATKRVTLRELCPNNFEFKYKKAAAQTKKIADPQIRQMILDFLNTKKPEKVDAWVDWCKQAINPKTGAALKFVPVFKDDGSPDAQELRAYGINSSIEIEKGLKNVEKILDPQLRQYVGNFLKSLENMPLQEAAATWNDWCDHAVNPFAGNARLTHVRIVDYKKADLDEYQDVSKDGFGFRGQFKRADQHRGQFLCLDKNGKPEVIPVYAFQSLHRIKQEIQASGTQVIDFFQSGCQIELDVEVIHGDITVKPGRYILNSMQADRRIQIKEIPDTKKKPLPLSKISEIAHTFRRIK